MARTGELKAQLTVRDIQIDLVARRVSVGGRRLDLSPVDRSLLYVLAANAGEPVSREQLLERVWGDGIADNSIVDQHVRVLRAQLRDDARRPKYIETVFGVGYRLLREPRS